MVMNKQDITTSQDNEVAVFVSDIVWDTDGEEVAELPESVVLFLDLEEDPDIDDVLGEALSDEYGYCVEGFRYQF